ncbi:hypothetical protein LUZ60_008810 [Juncus effusus]|nr:hypothetical protein LUZ60_008810 [Juncus effusus]
MPIETSQRRVVCVTGAGGFIASWLVKLLLEKGYTVRGTVRNPDDVKNSHLRSLEGAKDRLLLLRADLLDRESLMMAFSGCEGVFHTASPVTDDPEEMIEPAVRGTRNVIDAAADVGVRRVIFTSSIGSNWYCYGKTAAEQGAWQAAKERGLDLIVINPVLVLGPLLQPTVNASVIHILKYLTGSAKTYVNASQAYVHVKDVAEAHLKVYESREANGRYICAQSTLHRGELCRILAKFFPEYPIPNRCKDEKNPMNKGFRFNNRRLKDLGIKFTPVSQCIYETVRSLQDKGILSFIS